MTLKENTMRKTRYEYLHEIVKIVNPSSIIEIGIAVGKNAEAMIRTAGSMVKYTGYDVFDTVDFKFQRDAGNTKEVHSKKAIYNKLSRISPNVTLHEGKTEDTLWAKGDRADLVWLDGDHRLESIRKDYEAVKDSRVIIFDDYYTTQRNKFYDRSEYGCYEIFKDDDNALISPETIDWGNIRIAVKCNDSVIHKNIQELFNEY
jgi:hypothetical protein